MAAVVMLAISPTVIKPAKRIFNRCMKFTLDFRPAKVDRRRRPNTYTVFFFAKRVLVWLTAIRSGFCCSQIIRKFSNDLYICIYIFAV